MMNLSSHLRLAAVAIVSAWVLPSCSWFQQQGTHEKEKEEKEPPPIYLGTIDQVYPDRQFALIRLIAPTPAPGTTLISHPADGSTGRVGNLSVSMERVDHLRVVADIRGGTVMRGDYVYAYRPLAEPTAKRQETPEESASNEGGDDTPLPETGSSLPANTGVLTLPESALPDVDQELPSQRLEPSAAPVPSVPSPTGPQAPRKAPSSLDDIPDTLDGLY